MNFKAFYDKIVDTIYDNRRNIMRISFSILALLLLIIVLYFKFNCTLYFNTICIFLNTQINVNILNQGG